MVAIDVDERNRIIGENLRKYRLLKGLTQDELAEGICSVSQLSKVENGKTYIKRDLLRQMADRLGVTIERIESTDALLDELTETLQWARDAKTAGNIEKAFELVEHVIEKCREFQYEELHTETLLFQCSLLIITQDYDAVIQIVEMVMEEGLTKDSATKAVFLCELGHAYQIKGDMVAAYDCYSRADDEFISIEGNEDTKLKIFFNLSKCHYLMNNTRTALRFAEKAEKLSSELSKYLWRLRSTLIKATVLERLGEAHQSEKIFLSLLKEAQDNGFLLDVGIIHNNFGELLQNRGDTPQAVFHFQRAVKVYDLLNEKIYMCTSLLHLAELSYLEREISKATEYIQQVISIVDEVEVNTYQKRAKAFHLQGWLRLAEHDFEGYLERLEESLKIYEKHNVVIEAYNVAVELAEILYERNDPRSIEFYRKAIELNRKKL
ncbi:MAG TPA: helix-turn-helix domain-containing protein [Bacilli bacterium]|nr:helix-turn-helix domain-containing protein [Bacilli bacterium]